MTNRGFLIGMLGALGAALVSSLVFLAAGAGPAGAAFPGENGRIAFSRDGDVWTMDPDGSGQTNLTNTPDVREGGPAFSPDGTRLVFVGRPVDSSDYRDSDIYTVDTDGTDQRRLTHNDRSEGMPTSSPDGEKIIFFADQSLRRMDAGGSDEETLDPYVAYEEPAVSPDGERIAYVSGDGEDNIVVVDADGSDPTRIAGPYYDIGSGPEWSPDGERVSFSVTHGPDGDDEFYENSLVDLHVADVDGSPEPRRVRTYEVGEGYHTWSPDSEKLAILGWESNEYELVPSIYVGGAETPDREPVAAGNLGAPDWGPAPAAPQRDATDPTVTRPRPAPGSEVRDRTPTIGAVVRDKTSELAESDLTLRVDGREKGFSYDLETDRLSRATKMLSLDRHTVEVTATDGAGNTATERWSFRVVRR